MTKFIEFRSHLQGVGLQLETVRSHEAMASAMKDVTKAMVSLNKQVCTGGVSRVCFLNAFDKYSNCYIFGSAVAERCLYATSRTTVVLPVELLM